MIVVLLSSILLTGWGSESVASVKQSNGSGDFSNPVNWIPTGAPATGDSVIIREGHQLNLTANTQIKSLRVEQGAQLNISSGFNLTLSGSVTVDGTTQINNGNITLLNQSPFTIGKNGMFIWDPSDNTAAGATLFINGIENFHPESHLIIRKWYSYSQVPLGKVVSGHFGNLTLTTLDNGLLFEWDQENYFEDHKIIGTLTIDQAWIVLDKSGSISNTEIGAIHLSNINSYLDLHNGEHTGTIKLTTGSITNVGGTFNGLVNGNGHVDLTVTGDYTNLGKSTLILNNGVQGTGNGNVRLMVNGKFRQTLGDFRGIFNITTKSSGVADLEFGTLEVHGGIFMAQYNCHVSGGLSKLKINGDVDIRLNHSNNIFRGLGLTTLSGTATNAQLQMDVAGNVFINGVNTAEVTTSASTGREVFNTMGDFNIIGSKTSFNYGNHQTEIYIKGNLVLENAELNLSKTKGTLIAEVGNNLYNINGNLNIKGGTGHGNLNVRGSYYQTGGKTNLYNNITEPAIQVVYVTVSGDFNMDGGEFSFNNMPASEAKHQLSLNGENFNIQNNAVIAQTVNIADIKSGSIHFDRTGVVNYNDNDKTSSITNIIISISDGCQVVVRKGEFIAPASAVNNSTMLNISNGGVLDLAENEVVNKKAQSFSKILVKDGGRIRISHPDGFYNGTTNAAVDGSNNLDFELEPSSIIEYYGSATQVITGTGVGLAQSEKHKYGILEVNKSTGKAMAGSNLVSIRTTLFLNNGELDLNGFNINILNGRTHGITRENGYIRSEHPSYQSKGIVSWKHVETGLHTIPFGTDEQNILPVALNIRTGAGRSFTVSTKTTEQNNRPLPAGISILPDNSNGEKIIDRWYYIHADGITADIQLPYLSIENTTPSDVAEENFSAVVWTGTNWKQIGGTGLGKVTENGSVESRSVQNWGHFLLVSNKLGDNPIQPDPSAGNTSNITAGQIHPNPFDVEFTTEFSMNHEKPLTLSLMQINGKVIKRILADGNQGSNKISIQTDSTLPNGIYILEITDGISSIQQKLVRYR